MPEQIRGTRPRYAISARLRILLVAAALGAFAASAQGEVVRSSADGFFVSVSAPVAATPAKTYAGVLDIGHWWSDAHTWSGSAANLSLTPEAGGCFCERWKDGSVEHGRVIMALKDSLLRLDIALGPLQELAVTGVMNISINSGDDGATRLGIDYRVNGTGASGLDVVAPVVDQQLSGELARLVRYIETGNPASAVSESEPTEPDVTDARAAIFAEWAKQAASDHAASAAKPVEPQMKTRNKRAGKSDDVPADQH